MEKQIKELALEQKGKKEELIAEQALKGITKILDLYQKQVKGEKIEDSERTRFKEWFEKMVNYQI